MIQTDTLRQYYYLTKPGIVYGNAIAAMAGFFFASRFAVDWVTFFAMLFGISLVIASACVMNNIIDRDIDAIMKRTQRRSMPSGGIGIMHAWLYGGSLLITGALILGFGTNLLTLAVALFGHIAYVGAYTYSKRRTVHSTLIGTISGSTPPVIGYLAVTGQADIVALLLYLIMVAWQMPHFYAIAIFRRDEYAAAGLPILSVVRGNEAVRKQIVWYVTSFFVAIVLLYSVGGTSLFWVLLMSMVALYWIYLCFDTSRNDDLVKWAKSQFGWSLYVLIIFSVSLSLDNFFH